MKLTRWMAWPPKPEEQMGEKLRLHAFENSARVYVTFAEDEDAKRCENCKHRWFAGECDVLNELIGKTGIIDGDAYAMPTDDFCCKHFTKRERK